MGSIHNDLSTWADKARARGHDTIEITVDLADKISDEIMDHAVTVDDLLDLQGKLAESEKRLLVAQELLAVLILCEGGTVEIMASVLHKVSSSPKYFVQSMLDHDKGVRLQLKDGDSPGSCRHCGCTEMHGCEEGCYWVEPDLCSACADPEEV